MPRYFGTHRTAGWVGPRADLDAVETSIEMDEKTF
jgi:hypothetical protein